eukprot:6212938-Pleurochrysis_carterae.AAC.4
MAGTINLFGSLICMMASVSNSSLPSELSPNSNTSPLWVSTMTLSSLTHDLSCCASHHSLEAYRVKRVRYVAATRTARIHPSPASTWRTRSCPSWASRRQKVSPFLLGTPDPNKDTLWYPTLWLL